MPSRLDAPVLTVDVGLIHKVDTRNVENLFSMWTVFSRCAGSLEEGRRLENLSWRLWNRETFCCEPTGEANATTPAISIASRNSEGRYSQPEVPELSGSVGSLDEEALEFDSQVSASTSTPPQIRRWSRGRERHITPDDLEKMVITIKEKKNLAPLTLTTSYLAPIPERSPLEPADNTPQQPNTPPVIDSKSISPESTSAESVQAASSDNTSGTSSRSTTSVVRGFSPSQVSSSYRSIPLLSAPSSIPTVDIALATASRTPATKKIRIFALGGSSGDDSFTEQTNSIDSNLHPVQSSIPQKVKPRSTLSAALQKPLSNKKQILFGEEVTRRTIQEEQPLDDDVLETDEEDEIDESAIDDDNSSEWEDSFDESGKSSVDEDLFKRVPSRLNLTLRPSLLTTMLHQNDRARALANRASKSTPLMQRSRISSPNGPSVVGSPDLDDDDNEGLMMKKTLKPISENHPTGAQPIKTTSTTQQLALSPRTTRRNMLSAELTVSLRQHILWERQQKSQTANAVLKRRHTAHDVANLRQYPEKVHLGTDDKDNHGSWNQYFSQGLGEYHSKGW